MLLIQKGKPTKRYCDRCHKRKVGAGCLNCQQSDRAAAVRAGEVYRRALELQAAIKARRLG